MGLASLRPVASSCGGHNIGVLLGGLSGGGRSFLTFRVPSGLTEEGFQLHLVSIGPPSIVELVYPEPVARLSLNHVPEKPPVA